MQRKDRLKVLEKIASSFRTQFISMPPGKEREEFIYQAAIKQPLPKLVPVQVTDPKTGIKVQYDVMPDYLMIDGIRVPVSAPTAQRLANHFGMTLPTAKMSKQIWDAADTKVKPTPMSGGANIGGKWYTGEQVVQSKINTSDTSAAFNDKVDKEIANTSGGKAPTLVAGHMKDLTVSDTGNKDRTHAVGWYNHDGTPIQGGNGVTMHNLDHSEYATGTRLIGNKFTFIGKDGEKIGPLTMEQLSTDPKYKQYANMISSNPAALSKYETGKPGDKPGVPPQTLPIAPKSTEQAKPSSNQWMSKMENFLKDLEKKFL